jgi:hypothetical protein
VKIFRVRECRSACRNNVVATFHARTSDAARMRARKTRNGARVARHAVKVLVTMLFAA